MLQIGSKLPKMGAKRKKKNMASLGISFVLFGPNCNEIYEVIDGRTIAAMERTNSEFVALTSTTL
jgi:hypothetical protein